MRSDATASHSAGQARLTFSMRFETAARCAKVMALVSEANEQNLDLLEAELARMA